MPAVSIFQLVYYAPGKAIAAGRYAGPIHAVRVRAATKARPAHRARTAICGATVVPSWLAVVRSRWSLGACPECASGLANREETE